jgi:hypothetical protein
MLLSSGQVATLNGSQNNTMLIAWVVRMIDIQLTGKSRQKPNKVLINNVLFILYACINQKQKV